MTRMHRLAKPYHGSGRACPCHVSPTYSPTSRIRQQSPTRIGFLVRPLRGRMERGNQGTPLKPRQGPCPWTTLLKNLYLKGGACVLFTLRSTLLKQEKDHVVY